MSNKLQAIVHNPMEGTAHKLGALGPNGHETTGDLPVALRVEIVVNFVMVCVFKLVLRAGVEPALRPS
jgi:hypothetical protein